jgi:hypothetical protein
VSVENIGVFSSQLALSSLSNCKQLSASKANGRSQPPRLALYVSFRQCRSKNMSRAALYSQHSADNNSFRHGQAMPLLFLALAPKQFVH